MTTTICTHCIHFINLEPSSPRAHVWYNHLCRATPLPRAIDLYDGKEKPCGMNDLGTRYFSDKEFAYCRDINDGHCPKFEEPSKEPTVH